MVRSVLTGCRHRALFQSLPQTEPRGRAEKLGALAAGSTQARGRGKEERWDLGQWGAGYKGAWSVCASEFQVLGGTQGSSLS